MKEYAFSLTLQRFGSFFCSFYALLCIKLHFSHYVLSVYLTIVCGFLSPGAKRRPVHFTLSEER